MTHSKAGHFPRTNRSLMRVGGKHRCHLTTSRTDSEWTNRFSFAIRPTAGGEGVLCSCSITLTTPAPRPSKPPPAGPEVHKVGVSFARSRQATTRSGLTRLRVFDGEQKPPVVAPSAMPGTRTSCWYGMTRAGRREIQRIVRAARLRGVLRPGSVSRKSRWRPGPPVRIGTRWPHGESKKKLAGQILRFSSLQTLTMSRVSFDDLPLHAFLGRSEAQRRPDTAQSDKLSRTASSRRLPSARRQPSLRNSCPVSVIGSRG